MTTLRPASAGSEAVLAESLGTAVATLRIIIGVPGGPARTLPVYYGRPSAMPEAELVTELSTVRTLLEATRLDFTELAAALDARFVNPGGQAAIETTDPKHPCATDLLRISGLTGGLLDRLHRFTRLRVLTGWPADVLDRVIHAVTPGALDSVTASCVVAVRALTDRLDLPADRLLACCGPLDTHRYQADGEPPLYDRIFLADTVAAALPGEPSPFALTADRTEVAVIGDLLARPVSAALLGALEITDDELAELLTGPRAVVPDTRLTPAHLSALVGAVTLARAVGLPAADMLRLIELRGGGPLSSSSPPGSPARPSWPPGRCHALATGPWPSPARGNPSPLRAATTWPPHRRPMPPHRRRPRPSPTSNGSPTRRTRSSPADCASPNSTPY